MNIKTTRKNISQGSKRKIAAFNLLMEHFKGKHFSLREMYEFLGINQKTAFEYRREMEEFNVVIETRPYGGSLSPAMYRITTHQPSIDDLMTYLQKRANGTDLSNRSKETVLRKASVVKVQRDPLVAAIFGPA